MATRQSPLDLVVIGGSAGSIQALGELMGALPAGFAAPVLVVVHMPPDAHSFLPEILSRAGALPAVHPTDDEPLLPGRVYVAPPDYHLVVQDGRARLSHGPRENGYRPSVDTLFRTAARSHGSRVAGVLLSGALSDGVAGLWAIKRSGGMTIAQDPADALIASMPAEAIERVGVDETAPAREIGSLLAEVVGSSGNGRAESPPPAAVVREEPIEDVESGVPSVFACPDCGGVLWEVRDGGMTRYRCRVGHAYSPEGLDERQQDQIEDGLWAALRALDENAELSARLAERSRERGLDAAARRFEERARTCRRQSELIRAALESESQGGQRDVPEPLRGEIATEREEVERTSDAS